MIILFSLGVRWSSANLIFILLLNIFYLSRSLCWKHLMALSSRAMLLHVMVSFSFFVYFFSDSWVVLTFTTYDCLILFDAVCRLKADNPLYGSSLIDYVRHFMSFAYLVHFLTVYFYFIFMLRNWLYVSHILVTSHWQAHIEQWIDFSSLEVDANLINWFRPRVGRAVYLPPVSCPC